MFFWCCHINSMEMKPALNLTGSMQKISYQRHRFPPLIIQHAVWLYAQFTLSYRDVEDLLAARGLDISYETIRRWFLKFGTPIARNLRSSRPAPNDIWHLDEMVIVIRGKRYFLWRAVVSEGEVLDFPVQLRRPCCRGLRFQPPVRERCRLLLLHSRRADLADNLYSALQSNVPLRVHFPDLSNQEFQQRNLSTYRQFHRPRQRLGRRVARSRGYRLVASLG